MAFHGAFFNELIDPCYFLIEDYLIKKSLSKIGIRQDYDDLDCFEVEYLTFIDREFYELEKKANDKNRHSGKHR
jgi:hypothetical protein